MADHPTPPEYRNHLLLQFFSRFSGWESRHSAALPWSPTYGRWQSGRKAGSTAQIDEGVALCQAIPGATAMQVTAYTVLSSPGRHWCACSVCGFWPPCISPDDGTLRALCFNVRPSPGEGVIPRFAGDRGGAGHLRRTVWLGRTSLKRWFHALIAGIAAVLYSSPGKPHHRHGPRGPSRHHASSCLG